MKTVLRTWFGCTIIKDPDNSLYVVVDRAFAISEGLYRDDAEDNRMTYRQIG